MFKTDFILRINPNYYVISYPIMENSDANLMIKMRRVGKFVIAYQFVERDGEKWKVKNIGYPLRYNRKGEIYNNDRLIGHFFDHKVADMRGNIIAYWSDNGQIRNASGTLLAVYRGGKVYLPEGVPEDEK